MNAPPPPPRSLDWRRAIDLEKGTKTRIMSAPRLAEITGEARACCSGWAAGVATEWRAGHLHGWTSLARHPHLITLQAQLCADPCPAAHMAAWRHADLAAPLPAPGIWASPIGERTYLSMAIQHPGEQQLQGSCLEAARQPQPRCTSVHPLCTGGLALPWRLHPSADAAIVRTGSLSAGMGGELAPHLLPCRCGCR
jgi:hypothetical protein